MPNRKLEMTKKVLTNPRDILNIQNIKPVEVEVPEWGCTVLVGSLSGVNREKWEQERRKEPPPTTIRAMLVAFTVVNQNGELLFTEKDIDALNKKDWRALDRISEAAIAFNVVGQQNIEEEAKN